MIEYKKSNLISAFIICSVTALACNFLLLFRDILFPTIDLRLHYQWVSQFKMALEEGILYPRYAPLSNLGLGEPNSVYLHPIYYYITSFIVTIMHNIWLSMKVAALISNFAAGIFVFLLIRRMLPLAWSLLAAALIQAMPLLFFLINYHSALPWHFSLPLLVLAIFLSLYPSKYFINIPLSLTIAALVMTHFLVGFMALACLPFLFLAAVQENGFHGAIRKFTGWSLSVLLGLCLAMVYLLPALTTQHLICSNTWVDAKYLNWRNSFAFPLITSKIYGTRWFNLQWTISIVPLLSLVTVLVILFHTRKKQDPIWYLLLKLSYISAVGLFLASELAYPLYACSGFLRSVEWPYRFITVSTVSTTLALPIALMKSIKTEKAIFWRALPAIPIVYSLILFLGLQYQVATQGKNAGIGPQTLTGKFGLSQVLPLSASGLQWERYVQMGGLEKQCKNANVRCETLIKQSHRRLWLMSAEKEAYIVLPVFAFPAWVAYLDGRQVSFKIDPDTGLIAINIPVGEHKLLLKWVGLPQEHIGFWISVVTLVILTFIYGAQKFFTTGLAKASLLKR